MADYGMNMALVGNRNRATILNYINKKGSVSRKEIAEATGLTAAAVTQISQGLIKDGILVELGTMDGEGAGRKRVMLDINYNCRYVVSVNIEQRRTVIAICNMKGDAVCRSTVETDTSVDAEIFVERLCDTCEELIKGLKEIIRSKLTAVSVGIPGIVDRSRGVSVHAYGIWDREVGVCRIMEEKLKMPCVISNNVDAFAQASSLYGIGRNFDNILVLKWGPGVGGTIVIDNKVYDGRHGKAAEIGHFIVRKNGRKCNCGRNGCLETVVSFGALNQVISFSEGQFESAYGIADEKQKEMLYDAVELFARSIVNTITVLAPDRVILCGFLFKEEILRDKFLEAVKEFDPSYAERRILYTELSEVEDYVGPVASYVMNALF